MTTFSGDQPAYCQQDSLMKLSRCEWLTCQGGADMKWPVDAFAARSVYPAQHRHHRDKALAGLRPAGLVGLSFEYSYTCLASRLRRWAQSDLGI